MFEQNSRETCGEKADACPGGERCEDRRIAIRRIPMGGQMMVGHPPDLPLPTGSSQSLLE